MIWKFCSFLLLTVRITLAKCPLSCHCYERSTIYSIFCVHASLASIPNSFDFNVKIFNFTGNRVPTLPSDAFRNPYFANLEILDLKNNRIRTIASKALYKLKNLLEIDLSDNDIRLLNGKTFVKNRFLNTLRLNGNPLEEIKSHTFPPLIYLKKLDFQGCKLKKIHRSAFVNTPSLVSLNLKDNALKAAPTNALHHLTQLSVLQLDGNPWKCDENLWHLLKWMQSKNCTSRSYLLCIYGETENAVFWDTMDANDASIVKFQNIRRNKRAVVVVGGGGGGGGEKTESVRKRIIASKGQQNQREYTPKRDLVATPKTRFDDDNDNCTQENEYSPGRFLNQKKNDTNTTSERTPAIQPPTTVIITKKDKNISSPLLKAQNITSRVRYNNAKVVKNYVDQSKNYSKFHKLPYKEFKTSNLPRGLTQFMPQDKAAGISNVTADQIYPQYQRSYEDDWQEAGEATNFFEENHVIVLTVEVTLIIILLVILYKLWKEGRKRAEQGANVPLNNSGKKVKTYDTQTSGYKRYSLSDEDYPDIRDNRDEGKYDAESGYLSYHRYNSIEGENTNDYAYLRRFYGNENDANSEDANGETLVNHSYHSNEPSVGANFVTSTISRRNSASRRSRKEQHSANTNGIESSVDVKNRTSDDDNNN